MERLKRVVADAVFAFQILIVFVLLFESAITVPAALQSFGRMHPLLLHLPIGLLIIAVILLFGRRHFQGEAMEAFTDLLLHVTALTASLTTLMGLFLSLEGSFGADQIAVHKWLGVILSFVCWGLLAIRKKISLLKPAIGAAVVLLIFTGHYGANLTHGSDFVLAPLRPVETPVREPITDSSTVFTAAIAPVLEAKCVGCHNPRKAKGNLVLSTPDGIAKGGESGALWHPQDAASSLIVERLMLPLDHDDHMPPKDKAQLSEDEIALISLWIDNGADMTAVLRDLTPDDTLSYLSSTVIRRYHQRQPGDQQHYAFEFVSPGKLSELSRPNRSVFQVARNEPAVQANFYLREAYTSGELEDLLAVKEQLISLNLAKMPLKDGDLKVISKFSNLEVLNLNNTGIGGDPIAQLAALIKLKSLSLSGTNVTAETLRSLGKIPALAEVYLWNTTVSASDAESLRREFPKVNWNIGYEPDTTYMLLLNPPILRNKDRIIERDEKVLLKHNLPGTEVRYTLDGSDPDSIDSPVYKEGIAIDRYTVLKARAYKDGWLKSDIVQYYLFPRGIYPDTAWLSTAPNEPYQGEGVKTLIDGQQAMPNYFKYPAWMGFKDQDLVLNWSFKKDLPTISSVTLSFGHNRWNACMPPDKMELWAGQTLDDMRLIAKIDPSEVPLPDKPRIEGMVMSIEPSQYRHYRLVAKPMKLLNGKQHNRDIWLMVDEVFMN